MPQEIKSYLQLGEVFKRGYWYLAEYYIVIGMYGIDPPHIYPKLLTPRNFVLVEYIKQMVEVDNLHFVKSKKKGTPHIYPKMLTPRNFVLVEYIKQMVEVDNLHFVKSKKKGRDKFPIVMGGYAINNNKFLEQLTKVLKK